MTMDIRNYFEQSQIALAAYSSLDSSMNGMDSYIAALTLHSGANMSDTQAEQFAENYQIIDQYTSPLFGSGFSATVFKKGDEYFFAIRGTDDPIDLLGADFGDIGGDGIAIDQVMDLYNYYQRLSAPAGATVWQYDYHAESTISDPNSPTGLSTVPPYIDAVQLAGGGLGFLDGVNFTVTGHSLGGHLAIALSRLVPAAVTAVYTYNAPGFDPVITNPYPGAETFFNLFRDAEITFAGSSNILGYFPGFFDTNKNNNLVITGDDIHKIGFVPASQLTVFSENENEGWLDAHRMEPIADALTVYNVLATLDNNLDNRLPELLDLFRSASNTNSATLESMVNTLGDLVSAGTTVATGSRDQLYQRISAIMGAIHDEQGNLEPKYQDLALTGLVSLSSNELITSSNNPDTALAYRYALVNLNPFVIDGANAQADAALYAPYIQDHTLELYDKDSNPEGRITEQYLKDRAEFLVADIKINLDDIDNEDVPNRITQKYFEDVDKGIKIIPTSYDPLLTERFVFGSNKTEAPDSLTGGDRDDHLYGQNGDDTLVGGNGMDYLEGGEGNDTLNGRDSAISTVDGGDQDILNGGNGYDTYIPGLGDVIDDSDGQGVIMENDKAIDISTISLAMQGSAVYTNNDADHPVRFKLLPDGSLQVLGSYFTIRNFSDGDFGIHLDGQPTPLNLNLIQGDAGPNNLTGTGGDDEMQGLAGDDRLAAAGGNDLLYGGSGNDMLNGGTGIDTLDGGDGDDNLEGGEGDDIVQGGEGRDIVLAASGNDVLLGGGGANFINGGFGNDYLEGGELGDFMVGDSGTDVLIGGPGDDFMLGDGGYFALDASWGFTFTDTTPGIPGSINVSFTAGIVGGTGSINDQGDFLQGDSGNDVLLGGGGGDQLYGGADEDVLEGGDGNDYLNGGTGNDALFGDSSTDPAAVGDDRLEGGAGDDYLIGGAGDDVLSGGDGADNLSGGEGDDELHGDAGADVLVAGVGDDIADGGDGDDQIDGGTGNDQLSGGVGNDLMLGDSGADVIDGGAGNDQLAGDGGEDTLLGGAGEDTLAGGDGNDVLRGGDANDTLAGNAGNDELHGDAGDDNVQGNEGGDHIYGEDGNDLLFGQEGDDQLYGGTGNDQLVGDAGNDILAGGDGDDILWGNDGNDSIDGGVGNDRMFGDNGIDVLSGNDGDDELRGGSEDDILGGGMGRDLLFGEAGNDVLDGGDGDDQLVGDAGNDVLQGSVGADLLFGGAGTDNLAGGGGNDGLQGDSGNDTLDGGAGNDTLSGNAGSDLYFYVPGNGQDIINNYDPNASGTGPATGKIDVLRFGSGINPDEINAIHDPAFFNNLVLKVNGSTDQVTVLNYFANSGSSAWRLDRIEFADGTVWTPETIPLLIQGMTGNDTLTGTSRADVFDGGAGNDSTQGGTGNDTYRFGRGYGQDTVTDTDSTAGNIDKVYVLADVLPSAVTLLRSSNNLLLSINGTADRLTLINYFVNDGISANSIEQIKFAVDGTVWDVNMVKQMVLIGTDGDDTLIGYATDDTLGGLGGNDTLTGNAGNDTLNGGPGNDTLQGGVGNDTYLFGRGLGQDTITDVDSTAGNTDTVQLAPDVFPADVTLQRNGDALIFRINGTADQLTINNYFVNDATSSNLVERIKFLSDGTVWDVNTIKSRVLTGTPGDDLLIGYTTDDTLTGLGGNDTLLGNAGNDTLNGGPGSDNLQGAAGNDIYLFSRGDGTDTIFDYASSGSGIDTLRFATGILPADVSLLHMDVNDNRLYVHVAGSGDYITIENYFYNDGVGPYAFEHIEFAEDGTLWDTETVKARLLVPTEGNDTLIGYNTDDVINGRGGDDLIQGGYGNDILNGGAGNDTLTGNYGNDTYLFSRGSGRDLIYNNADYADSIDVLKFAADILPQNITASRSNMDLVLTITGAADASVLQDYFYGNYIVDRIEFGDGSVWTENTIAAMFPLNGTAGNDTIQGFALSENINGLGGDDVLRGGDGNDTIDGGAGADLIYGEEGNDILYAGQADGVPDRLNGGNGNDVLVSSGDKTFDYLYGELGNDIYLGGTGPDWMEDKGGSNLLYAGDNTDDLWGGNNNDLYIGGGALDFIDGDRDGNGITGHDVLFFNRGDKTDSIDRLGQATAISLGGGILYSQLKLERNGTGLVLKLGHNEEIAFNDWYDSYQTASHVKYLQIVIDGTRNYNPLSVNPWENQKVVVFDFGALVAAFDAAQATGQRFNVSSSLSQYYVWGSDTMAYGGKLAYEYAVNGNLGNVTIADMQNILGDTTFGVAPQSIITGTTMALATNIFTGAASGTTSNLLQVDPVNSGEQFFTGSRLQPWQGTQTLNHNLKSPAYTAVHESLLINKTVDQLVQAMARFNIDPGHAPSRSTHLEPEGIGPVLAANLQQAA